MAELQGLFDLFYVFVELIGGNLFTAYFLIAIIMTLMSMIMRVPPTITIFLLMQFTAIYMGAYAGGFVAMVIFAAAMVIFYIWLFRFAKEAG